MKRIFVYSYDLSLGGIERSLIGLLNAIDYSKYQVDLFLVKHEGELFPFIPKEVRLLPMEKKSEAFGVRMVEAVKKRYYYEVMIRLYAKIKGIFMARKHENVGIDYIGNIYHKHIFKKFPSSKEEYDLALSFYFPHYYTLDKVKAPVKVGWIHTDYNRLYLNQRETLPMFERLDYIAAVSQETGAAFLKRFPELRSKVITVENMISPRFVHEQAALLDVSCEMNPNEKNIKLLSVGRFAHPKNFDNVPSICKMILAKGCPVKWYLIGYGGDEDLIREKIREEGMEETVILLGKKENPYPYMKACDLYIQPSRYEGKAVTVREAQILGKPVVITNFATAASQVEENVNGVIVPLDNEGCAQGIVDVVRNQALRATLTQNCLTSDFGNEAEVEKLYNLCEVPK